MAGKRGDDAHFEAVANALDTVTNEAANHQVDPQATLHKKADTDHSHGWMRSLFPYHSLQEMENAFHLGNYVIDRKTGQKSWESMSIYVRLGMHALYYGSEQEKALHWKRTLQLLEAQSVKMGKEYDDPKSVDHIVPFIQSFDLQASMAEMVQPDPSKYRTFNEFFSREIRPDARPPAEPQDPLVISSVADCRITTFPTIDLATKYWIKGYGFTIAKLLGSDDLARQFDGGSIAIHRLAPQDYHRWHSPVDGTVASINEIPGAYYTVNPQAINEAGTMDVFCENRRSVMIMQRTATGAPIAVIAVGAMLVGSIAYNPGVAPGAQVRRAQCLGKFQYGGSTVITVYPRGEVEFDQDLVRNSTEQNCETLVQVGWRVARGPAGRA
ncbi:hypothetical protein K461DRAFT_266698 [Myriangium duriaei CBS 260.36]|uniref:phosphatidylserine decarboxylase n=1 Tax=Myriangium duriaei CBS 260.36 TaxID=1168546 RepID=A0A9P4J959_9PEZI|nr:hypothetical protein K461DRAFT_266698 [Myriangium duriaei CBS 260.36]